MRASIDAIKISFACTKCGKKLDKTIAWLKGHATFTCPWCGERFNTKKFTASIKKIEEAAKKLDRTITIKL